MEDLRASVKCFLLIEIRRESLAFFVAQFLQIFDNSEAIAAIEVVILLTILSLDLHVTFAVHPIASNGLGGVTIKQLY